MYIVLSILLSKVAARAKLIIVGSIIIDGTTAAKSNDDNDDLQRSKKEIDAGDHADALSSIVLHHLTIQSNNNVGITLMNQLNCSCYLYNITINNCYRHGMIKYCSYLFMLYVNLLTR